jgi:hypothetical protein
MKTRHVHPEHRWHLIALGTLLAVAGMSAWCQTTADKKVDKVLLADGTPIHLVLMDDLQGKQLQAKQTVHFRVREDLGNLCTSLQPASYLNKL